VGAPDCEKAELKYIYLLMKINGLKIASGWFNPPCFLVGPPGPKDYEQLKEIKPILN
jgi:hypothetical protein